MLHFQCPSQACFAEVYSFLQVCNCVWASFAQRWQNLALPDNRYLCNANTLPQLVGWQGVGTKSLKDAECIGKVLDQGKSDRIQVRSSSGLGGRDSQNLKLFFLASLSADVNEQRDKGDGFGEHGSVAGQQSINQIRIFPPVVCNVFRGGRQSEQKVR